MLAASDEAVSFVDLQQFEGSSATVASGLGEAVKLVLLPFAQPFTRHCSLPLWQTPLDPASTW